MTELISSSITSMTLVEDVIFIIGLFFLFPKCGIKRIWSIIPGFRDYKIAQSADMEDEGRIWFFSNVAVYVCNLTVNLAEWVHFKLGLSDEFIIFVLLMIFGIINLIYGIRIYAALCRNFRVSRLWIVAWILFRGVTALLWGLFKRFTPTKRIEDFRSNAAAVSEKQANAEAEGLTININKRIAGSIFKRKTLLRDIHFSIKPSRMVLLLGGSGAGKTTFINSVTGYEKADASIFLNGKNVYKEFDRMKYEIGFVPQQDLIRYQDTVYNTLMDAAALRLPAHYSRKEIAAKVDEVMDVFGLKPVKDSLVGKQSGGQKKRISIACEFVSAPTLYVLDEPDSGLDGILAKDLMKRLHDISRKGKIVIVITHTPDRVLEYFDDVIVLAKDQDRTGRLVYYGPIDEAKKFFERDTMEQIVKSVNRVEEGGDGRADELIEKFGGLKHEW